MPPHGGEEMLINLNHATFAPQLIAMSCADPIFCQKETAMTLSRKVLLVLSVSALFMGPVSPILSTLDIGAAHAKGGGDKGGGGGNGGGNGGGGKGGSDGGGGNKGGNDKAGNDRGSNGKGGNGKSGSVSATERASGKPAKTETRGNGSAASQLKGLNAAHANAQALASASPNSRVGRIAAYLGATQAAAAAGGALAEADAAFAALAAMDGNIAALAEAFPTFDDAAYQAAIDLADGDPARLSLLEQRDPSVMGEFALTDENGDPLTDDQGNPLYDETAYLDAIDAASPTGDLQALLDMTEDDKIAAFPDANGYDEEAYQQALADAADERQKAKEAAAAAEGDAEAALLAASNGNPLDEEARAYLARLLESKTLSPDQEAAVEEALDPAS